MTTAGVPLNEWTAFHWCGWGFINVVLLGGMTWTWITGRYWIRNNALVLREDKPVFFWCYTIFAFVLGEAILNGYFVYHFMLNIYSLVFG